VSLGSAAASDHPSPALPRPPEQTIRAQKGLRGSFAHFLRTHGAFRTWSSFEMGLVLNERNVGPITLMELGERLTIENVPELRDRVQELAIQGRRSLLLDCSQISAVDSQGIGGLVSNWLSLKSQGGRLKLLSPSVRMREVLKIAGLQKVIECFDDIEVALRNF